MTKLSAIQKFLPVLLISSLSVEAAPKTQNELMASYECNATILNDKSTATQRVIERSAALVKAADKSPASTLSEAEGAAALCDQMSCLPENETVHFALTPNVGVEDVNLPVHGLTLQFELQSMKKRLNGKISEDSMIYFHRKRALTISIPALNENFESMVEAGDAMLSFFHSTQGRHLQVQCFRN